MTKTDPRLEKFFDDATRWKAERRKLRKVLRGCHLEEQFKWGKACYSHDGNNVAILQPMKNHLALLFFKGALMEDPAGVLEEQGPNTRSARRICFTSVEEIDALDLKAYVADAVAIAESGREVSKPDELVLVEELQRRLDEDPELKAAFEALTPGRQREYQLYISAAKQAATRERRIDKHVAKILSGKGLRD